MRIAALLVLVACSESTNPDREPDAAITTRTVATFAPEGISAMAIAPLDASIAIARVDRTGDAFCPDCVGLDPTACPALCKRALVSVATVSMTGEHGPKRDVATVFPASYDHSVDQVAAVALGGTRVGIAWLACDNARCGGLFAKRSCTAHYATVDLATGAVGAPATLYTNWFGELSLAFDRTSRRLFAVLGKDLVMGLGVWRATFDEHGARLADWTPVGSAAARSPALAVDANEAVVIVDDWSPAAPPRAAPCAESCECLDGGTIDLERGGLFAHVAGSATRIADGRDARGFYGRREQIAAIDAGGRTLVATTQSIDRNAELFAFDGAWQPLLSTPAPIPTWLGALGTADRAAWLGTQPEQNMATVQRLVAGVATPDVAARIALDDPFDRAILLDVPVPSERGVTTSLLLQGVREAAGWARFELLAVEAPW